MDNRPIGILDSGVGGLSIWKEIISKLPAESTIYIADTKNCPYGDKTKERVYQLAKLMVDFLIGKKVKLIILACNTITVSCLSKLRDEFPQIPIVGTVPVVKTAVEQTKNKKIGILSTSVTAKSAYQKNLIDKFASDCEVISIGTERLVPFVEKGEIATKNVKDALKEELSIFKKNNVDAIALGCSHFPFLRNTIEKVMGKKVKILDSAGAIARQVERVLTNNKKAASFKNPSYEFYTTGEVREFTDVSKRLVGRDFAEAIEIVKNVSL